MTLTGFKVSAQFFGCPGRVNSKRWTVQDNKDGLRELAAHEDTFCASLTSRESENWAVESVFVISLGVEQAHSFVAGI